MWQFSGSKWKKQNQIKIDKNAFLEGKKEKEKKKISKKSLKKPLRLLRHVDD